MGQAFEPAKQPGKAAPRAASASMPLVPHMCELAYIVTSITKAMKAIQSNVNMTYEIRCPNSRIGMGESTLKKNAIGLF